MTLLAGVTIGLALRTAAGVLRRARRGSNPAAQGGRVPAGSVGAAAVRVLLPHPPACVCGGTGHVPGEADRACPVVWSRPAERIRLVGRLPRGSQR